jgi:ABC-type multidrug transport system ATPase subunit
MSELAIETRDLTRSFGRRVAVDHLNLRVVRGTTYGFLGQNGAGKTTTIRLLLGLLRPSAGDVLLNGERLTPARRGLLREVGALVETPSLYPHLTGEENLDVTRRLLALPVRRVHDVLETFGLTKDARRAVRTYSTGMRQLLALALAWLGQPRLLVLDEPAGSLDPGATRKLRACCLEASLPPASGRSWCTSIHGRSRRPRWRGCGRSTPIAGWSPCGALPAAPSSPHLVVWTCRAASSTDLGAGLQRNTQHRRSFIAHPVRAPRCHP